MSLIAKVGNQGIAEIIVSLVLTRSIMPNCYLPEFKAYGQACTYSNALFVFDEKQNEFLPYMPLDEAKDQYVMLDELLAELKALREQGVAA